MTTTLIAKEATKDEALNSVRIDGTRFGTLDVEDDLIITLDGGLIGFEDCTRFVVVNRGENDVIQWLQALDRPSLALPIIDPWLFKPDYAPAIARTDADTLELREATPRLVFAVVTVPRDNPRGITANLIGPIIINARTRHGKQVIVTNEEYGTKHRIIGDQIASETGKESVAA